jgi:hypothetical protein
VKGNLFRGLTREGGELIDEYDFTALPHAEDTITLLWSGNDAERYQVYKVEHYFPDRAGSAMIAIMLERKHSPY